MYNKQKNNNVGKSIKIIQQRQSSMVNASLDTDKLNVATPENNFEAYPFSIKKRKSVVEGQDFNPPNNNGIEPSVTDSLVIVDQAQFSNFVQ